MSSEEQMKMRIGQSCAPVSRSESFTSARRPDRATSNWRIVPPVGVKQSNAAALAKYFDLVPSFSGKLAKAG
jgi:hypothetical protein